MKYTTPKLMLLAVLLSLCRYSEAAPVPQQDHPDLSKMTVSELEKTGDLARAQKNYFFAIDCFKAGIGKDRKNAVLYNKLGLSQLKANDLSGARNNFEKASKLNPKFADAVNNVGAVDYMRKQYGKSAKNFKKAVALEETRATFHVNLGAAWFSQKKMERAMAEYTRAMELDPDAFRTESKTGIAAQIASPEERAQYSYLLAKAYAKRGDVEGCLQCLKKAKEDGYSNMANVYKDEEFSQLRGNPKLHEVVPPPVVK